jgi:hypothetical protein
LIFAAFLSPAESPPFRLMFTQSLERTPGR